MTTSSRAHGNTDLLSRTPGWRHTAFLVMPPATGGSSNERLLDLGNVGVGRNVQRNQTELANPLAVDSERSERVKDSLALLPKMPVLGRDDSDRAIIGVPHSLLGPQDPIVVNDGAHDVTQREAANEERDVVQPDRVLTDSDSPQSLRACRRPPLRVDRQLEHHPNALRLIDVLLHAVHSHAGRMPGSHQTGHLDRCRET